MKYFLFIAHVHEPSQVVLLCCLALFIVSPLFNHVPFTILSVTEAMLLTNQISEMPGARVKRTSFNCSTVVLRAALS